MVGRRWTWAGRSSNLSRWPLVGFLWCSVGMVGKVSRFFRPFYQSYHLRQPPFYG